MLDQAYFGGTGSSSTNARLSLLANNERFRGGMSSSVFKVPFNDLGRNSEILKPELLSIFEEFLESGKYILGPQHALFESELSEYLGVLHVIGCANGTDALQLAMRGLGVRHGDQVLTAANSGGYATTAINLIGAEPVYADVDANSHLLTTATISRAINDQGLNPKVIVVTHLYGATANISKICDWAHGRGILVIEDCAQSLGAREGELRVGSIGDAATTSFYPTKNLGGLGDGGAVLTNNSNLAENIKKLRQYGWETKYNCQAEGGTNSRLDELQAAFLRLKLRSLDELNLRRREIHSRYVLAGKNLKFVNNSSDSFIGHLAVIETSKRSALQNHLHNHGVATDIHYPIPDHQQGIRKNKRTWSLPVTETLSTRILSIPLFPELLEEEILQVELALSSAPQDMG
jgi:dTDP-4-amino-4,6-dideoxygalactose transaminase